MADTVFTNVMIAGGGNLKAVDNGDGTYSLAVFSTGGVGSLGATTWVVADNAQAEKKAFAEILEASGYPTWVTDFTADEVQIQAAIDAIPLLL